MNESIVSGLIVGVILLVIEKKYMNHFSNGYDSSNHNETKLLKPKIDIINSLNGTNQNCEINIHSSITNKHTTNNYVNKVTTSTDNSSGFEYLVLAFLFCLFTTVTIVILKKFYHWDFFYPILLGLLIIVHSLIYQRKVSMKLVDTNSIFKSMSITTILYLCLLSLDIIVPNNYHAVIDEIYSNINKISDISNIVHFITSPSFLIWFIKNLFLFLPMFYILLDIYCLLKKRKSVLFSQRYKNLFFLYLVPFCLFVFISIIYTYYN